VDRERWEHIDRILEAVLERPAPDRLAYLARECAADEELHMEVQSLLAAHEQHDELLEHPAREYGVRILANGGANTLIGKLLGSYRIVRCLAAGGIGEVYLAEDTRLARPVAIKLLARHWVDDYGQIRRFRREALAASALNHPNILTIHEIGEWEGRDFIATEFVDGMTLREHLGGRTLGIEESLGIALQIASALAAAHSAGIVHRDIKPENIIVRPDGLVKVLDFGIAKHADPQRTPVSDIGPVTATGMVIGTAAYMSPEQARGCAVDERTDIWSLGVVLYEMLAGRVPFQGATATDRLAAILERQPAPLREMRSGVPVTLENIVSRVLAKDREMRYRNAVALAEDLRAVRNGLTAERRPGSSVAGLRHVRASALVAVIGIIACGLAGLWHFRPSPNNVGAAGRSSDRDAIHSVAVLPLLNVGGAPDLDYLADGITDSLIDDLSEISELKVMSRNAVFRYKGQDVNAQKVGDTLQVRAVLTGRVALRGDTLYLSVELVDGRDSSHIWGEHYQRKIENLIHIQEDIAREVTEKLRLRLSVGERDRLVRRRANNSEAYQLYLKGRFYWLKAAYPSWRPGTAPDFSKSREFFQRAIEADPVYALPYAGLGHYYAMSASNGLMSPEDGWPKAEGAFRKALELDATLPDTHDGLAVIQWIYHRDWASAEKELRLAIQLNPNHPDSLYARFLEAEGRFDEAIAQVRQATELDPLSIRYSSRLGGIYYSARRYEDSIRQYRQALELNANDVWVHEALGDAYERQGTYRDAIGEWRAALLLTGDTNSARLLGDTYARRGFHAAVRALARHKLERLATWTNHGLPVPAVEYARAHLRLGQKELALRWLARACDERTVFVLFINTDPFYDEIRADPRFEELVKRTRAPQ
jgi:eukaryotic-like serine/threonine-protein kinase